MANIQGVDGLSVEEILDLVARGGRFVQFKYCFSLMVVTVTQPTDIFFIRPGENAVSKAMPYVVISALLGWWGFPFGLIMTPIAIANGLGGGTDLTLEVTAPMRAAIAPPRELAPKDQVKMPQGRKPLRPVQLPKPR